MSTHAAEKATAERVVAENTSGRKKKTNVGTDMSNRCNPRTCPHTDLLQLARSARGQEKWNLINEIDMNHLKNEHFRLYAEHWSERAATAEESLEKALEQNRMLSDENKQLKATLAGAPAPAAKRSGYPSADATASLVVDPKNHVDGYCDALIQGPDKKSIWKCTDACRYGKSLCGLHTDHRYVIGSAQSTVPVVIVPTAAIVAPTAPTAATVAPTAAIVAPTASKQPKKNKK
jgi:hypothetical protein